MSTSTPPASRSNDILWAAVAILGVLAIGYFYVGPKITELKEARAVTLAKERDAQTIEAEIIKVNQIAQQLTAQTDTLKQLDLAAPTAAAYDQLLVALQALASESGVTLSSIQPTTAANTVGAVQQVSATVGLKGSYSGVHLFLESVVKNIRPITITNLALTNATDAKGASLLNATLLVSAAQVVAPVTKPATTGDAK